MFANVKRFITLFCFPFTAVAVQCDVSTTFFSFPAYDVLSISPTDATAQITVQCDQGLPFQVKMNAGLYAAGNFNSRTMQSAQTPSRLLYNLYLDPSYSQVWGDGSGFSLYYQGISGPIPLKLPVFGRIPAAQNVAAGQYHDSIVITVEW